MLWVGIFQVHSIPYSEQHLDKLVTGYFSYLVPEGVNLVDTFMVWNKILWLSLLMIQ